MIYLITFLDQFTGTEGVICPWLYDWLRASEVTLKDILIGIWYQIIKNMMTSSNGDIFRVTGHLCGESTHKGQWRGALMFSLICAQINGWVNNREVGDLRRHRAHYDVIVMLSSNSVYNPWDVWCSCWYCWLVHIHVLYVIFFIHFIRPI